MTVFDYDTTKPNPPDDPADDVTQMQTNTASVSGIIAVDHQGFNFANGGLHKQVTFLNNQAAPGLNGGVSDLYANVGPEVPANSWPFWQNGLSSAIQLAGTFLANNNGGMTLVNGIIIKWGTQALTTKDANQAGTVSFPVVANLPVFSTKPYVMIATLINNNISTTRNPTLSVLTVSSTQYTYVMTNNKDGDYSGFYWVAIGK